MGLGKEDPDPIIMYLPSLGGNRGLVLLMLNLVSR